MIIAASSKDSFPANWFPGAPNGCPLPVSVSGRTQPTQSCQLNPLQLPVSYYYSRALRGNRRTAPVAFVPDFCFLLSLLSLPSLGEHRGQSSSAFQALCLEDPQRQDWLSSEQLAMVHFLKLFFFFQKTGFFVGLEWAPAESSPLMTSCLLPAPPSSFRG